MDRRRLAAAVAILVAASASLATSQPITPPPSVKSSLDGTAELTPESPVAVQEFRVRLAGPNVAGGTLPTAWFDPTTVRVTPEGGEQVRLRVVGADREALAPSDSFRSLVDGRPSPQTWRLRCTGANLCEARFALIVEWEDAASEGTATVDWHIEANVEVWTGVAAGEPTVKLTAERVDVAAQPTLNVATASGEPVRLDARNRMAQWRVKMRLEDGPIDSAWGWPLITTGRLSPTKSIVSSPPEGEASDAIAFIDGVGDEPFAFDAEAPGETIEFEPFAACAPDEPCTAEYVVGLTWPDVRDGSAIDGGWAMEIRAIGADGSDVPVAIEVEPVPPVGMATGKASGVLVWSKGKRDEFDYAVALPQADEDDGSWDGLRVPSYGIWRATMRSTGTSPLPADFALNFGRYGGERRIKLDEEMIRGFIPIDNYPCRLGVRGQCQIDRDLAAGFSDDNLPSGYEITIEWELEIAVGTTDPDGGTLTIVENPSQ